MSLDRYGTRWKAGVVSPRFLRKLEEVDTTLDLHDVVRAQGVAIEDNETAIRKVKSEVENNG